MPNTMDDLKRHFVCEHLDKLLDSVSADAVLGHYSPEELLRRVSADELLRQ